MERNDLIQNSMASREEVIAAADATLEAAGLPTYSQLLATVEQIASEE